MKRSKRSSECESKIAKLPEEILIDILSRLSIKTIFSCRCVSKTWYNLLSSSNTYFTKLHFTRSPVQFIFKTRFSRFSLVEFEDNPEDNTEDNTEVYYFSPVPSRFSFSKCDLVVINSCNGFLCLAPDVYYFSPVKIGNPITGEYLNLPKHKMYSYSDRSVVSGFGFCAKTNQYKVVRLVHVFQKRGGKYKERVVEVYTIGTKSWRTIGTAPKYPIAAFSATYFNGKIHWVDDDLNSSEFIITFDVESETFGNVPPPPHFSIESMKGRRYDIKIGVLGEFLSISDNKELWVMKDYGSWTKVGFNWLVNPCQHQALKYLNGAKILMNHYDRELVCYDPVKKISNFFKVPKFPYCMETMSHVPSLMSFNDAMMRDKGAKLRTGMCRVQRKRRN